MHSERTCGALCAVALVVGALAPCAGAPVSGQPDAGGESAALFAQLDMDGDGIVTATDVHQHSVAFDQDHSASVDTARMVLTEFYDSDRDGLLSAAEVAHAWRDFLPSNSSANATMPQQVHLAVGAVGEMVVMWVTMAATPVPSPRVAYSPTSGASDASAATTKVAATTSTYTAGGWVGTIYTARLKGLAHGATYTYTVGTDDAGVPMGLSQPFTFITPPQPGSTAASFPAHRPLRLMMIADHGVFPLGFASTKAMVAAFKAAGGPGAYDGLVLAGDVSYAGGVLSGWPEWEFMWDVYTRMIQPLAAHMPFMTTVGNHENSYNYSAFNARYTMPWQPSGGSPQANFWFSFDIGGVHFVSTSSEHNHSAGSPQLTWMEADLAAAAARPDPPRWTIVSIHRPFYSSDLDGYHNASGHEDYDWPSIRTDMEPLLRRYNVDMTFTGHLHSYERTLPISNNGTVVSGGGKGSTVHVVQGNCGAWINEKWMKPSPAWSAARSLRYGWAHMNVTRTQLSYQAVDLNGTVIDAFTIEKPDDA